ncbi:uncharacterized protein ASCRUDRAFT_8365 [Ascoidea rubescens DSM 1968]|uniref:Uncharacterized protein n=1 Tax=Ascoidea rubescens DSM 1968 TaxID=1344418 RepID=A0A1D2VH16_9ASCO|nr:hypothetical protein ASCRUDRAFT_8365 [Ascoidea rubescens DSM 1968]ODV60767.1 hypothetical protein ASCRUDRAFT_8365 [Ascoidea rubescens DSM 1968]
MLVNKINENKIRLSLSINTSYNNNNNNNNSKNNDNNNIDNNNKAKLISFNKFEEMKAIDLILKQFQRKFSALKNKNTNYENEEQNDFFVKFQEMISSIDSIMKKFQEKYFPSQNESAGDKKDNKNTNYKSVNENIGFATNNNIHNNDNNGNHNDDNYNNDNLNKGNKIRIIINHLKAKRNNSGNLDNKTNVGAAFNSGTGELKKDRKKNKSRFKFGRKIFSKKDGKSPMSKELKLQLQKNRLKLYQIPNTSILVYRDYRRNNEKIRTGKKKINLIGIKTELNDDYVETRNTFGYDELIDGNFKYKMEEIKIKKPLSTLNPNYSPVQSIEKSLPALFAHSELYPEDYSIIDSVCKTVVNRAIQHQLNKEEGVFGHIKTQKQREDTGNFDGYNKMIYDEKVNPYALIFRRYGNVISNSNPSPNSNSNSCPGLYLTHKASTTMSYLNEITTIGTSPPQPPLVSHSSSQRNKRRRPFNDDSVLEDHININVNINNVNINNVNINIARYDSITQCPTAHLNNQRDGYQKIKKVKLSGKGRLPPVVLHGSAKRINSFISQRNTKQLLITSKKSSNKRISTHYCTPNGSSINTLNKEKFSAPTSNKNLSNNDQSIVLNRDYFKLLRARIPLIREYINIREKNEPKRTHYKLIGIKMELTNEYIRNHNSFKYKILSDHLNNQRKFTYKLKNIPIQKPLSNLNPSYKRANSIDKDIQNLILCSYLYPDDFEILNSMNPIYVNKVLDKEHKINEMIDNTTNTTATITTTTTNNNNNHHDFEIDSNTSTDQDVDNYLYDEYEFDEEIDNPHINSLIEYKNIFIDKRQFSVSNPNYLLKKAILGNFIDKLDAKLDQIERLQQYNLKYKKH